MSLSANWVRLIWAALSRMRPGPRPASLQMKDPASPAVSRPTMGFIPEALERRAHNYQLLVAVPAEDLAGRTVRLRFRIRAVNSLDLPELPADSLVSFMFFADPKGDRPPVSDAFARHNVTFGPEDRKICLVINVPEDASAVVIYSYTARSVPVGWCIEDFHFLDGEKRYTLSNGVLEEEVVSLRKSWQQDGNEIKVTWLGNTFYADMPEGYDLSSVPKNIIEIVEDLLFGNIEQKIFNIKSKFYESLPCPSDFGRNPDFTTKKIILCFSGGEDSTAALRLLPPHLTQPFFSERPYDAYFTANGTRVRLMAKVNEEHALSKVENLIRIPTDFETIGVSVGERHGYHDNYGYAALGILLAHHVGANVLAFGSVMEQVFMKSGNDFTDVVFYKPSRYNKYRNAFASCGILYSLPVGTMSEVITNRICALSRDRFFAIPCPSPTEDGEPCGRCFKCFRKLRLEGRRHVPPPADSVCKTLIKRPLKSASSLVYSVQKSGYDGQELDEYRSVNLSFLDRYFASHLPLLVPPDVARFISGELDSLGIEPMTAADECRLRTIAKVFAPEDYSERRAFPEA